MRAHVLGLVAGVVLVAVGGASLGCKKAPPPEESSSGSPSPSSGDKARPVDHVAAGELLEGTEMAFGLALPRAAHVEGAFSDVVLVTMRASVDSLVAYFRARVREGTLRKGNQSATFEHAKVPGKPGLEVSVQLRALSPQESRIEVRDTTPVPGTAKATPEETWRALGMKPNGQPLDPTRVE
jgi:hypothetical protein